MPSQMIGVLSMNTVYNGKWSCLIVWSFYATFPFQAHSWIINMLTRRTIVTDEAGSINEDADVAASEGDSRLARGHRANTVKLMSPMMKAVASLWSPESIHRRSIATDYSICYVNMETFCAWVVLISAEYRMMCNSHSVLGTVHEDEKWSRSGRNGAIRTSSYGDL